MLVVAAAIPNTGFSWPVRLPFADNLTIALVCNSLQGSSIGSCSYLKRAIDVTSNIGLQPTAAGAILSHRG